MRIALDAMGSDTCPEPEIGAAIQAAEKFNDEIYLVGPVDKLEPRIHLEGKNVTNIHLINAPDVVTMHDKVIKVARKE